MDNGNVTMLLLLLDLSVAFDTVSLYFNKSVREKRRNKRESLRLVQIISRKQTTMHKYK